MEILHGLSPDEAAKRLKQYGLNQIPEQQEPFWKKLFQLFFSPISLMLLAAAILSYISNRIFDVYFILSLLLLNIGISIWQERKADNAIKKLNEKLTNTVKVLRGEKWEWINAKLITVGDIIPADGRLLDSKNASANEAALTGESLPKDKKNQDKVFSGSFLATGLATIEITAVGQNTSFGRTIMSVEGIKTKSILEQDIIRISKFLSIMSITGVIILSLVFIFQKYPITDLLTLDLSLLIAGIPISLPTVMTLIIALGVLELSKKQVIVRRLSALEDLANVNLLLTDKTGTLTQNKIIIQNIFSYEKYNNNNVLLYAYLASFKDDHNLISQSIIQKAQEEQIKNSDYEIIDYTPADSIKKRSNIIVKKDKETIAISLGAPQIIENLCKLDKKTKKSFEDTVSELARKGYRALAVATTSGKEEKNMKLVGLLALSDEVRPDAQDTIAFLKQNAIDVVMLTGDNKAITTEIARILDIPGEEIIDKNTLEKIGWDHITEEIYKKAKAFAEILPEDKLHLVKIAKKYFTVATNGDGVNDLPAIKEANVGFAVANAVSSLKATADIVLLANGISVIKDAIIEGRKIFQRLYSYSVYRISESFRLIITIVLLGLIYKEYPLTPLQIILIALLNDIPIISLAFDRVKTTNRPAKINVTERFVLSTLYGATGIANSIILFLLMVYVFHLSWNVIQTVYFLKLTVSGHMLIYVARTKERWFKFLPSYQVIWATSITQIIATIIALTGFFMPAKIPFVWALIVWIWSFFWMQIAEITKDFQSRFSLPFKPTEPQHKS